MQRRHALRLLSSAAALPAVSAHALYDPQPEPVLAAVLGEWKGTLTYRDYQQPDRFQTLPTRLFVSALAPDEISLHYVYDDGPGKVVYSYERLRFEFASNTLVWISGSVEKTALVGRIVSSSSEGGSNRFVVDTTKDRALSRYTFDFSPRALKMQKDEIDSGGRAVNRNRYAFARG